MVLPALTEAAQNRGEQQYNQCHRRCDARHGEHGLLLRRHALLLLAAVGVLLLLGLLNLGHGHRHGGLVVHHRLHLRADIV